MTGKQNAVLWMGLILVALNLISKWSTIRDVIFNGAGVSSSSSTPAKTPPVVKPGISLFLSWLLRQRVSKKVVIS